MPVQHDHFLIDREGCPELRSANMPLQPMSAW